MPSRPSRPDGKPEQTADAALRQSVDRVLTRAWHELAMPASAALVAVGGYGRGELFPHSDVDVLVLLRAAPDACAAGASWRNWSSCSGTSGLEIGHSMRTIDECMAESAADITVQTSLLEARLVTGSRSLFHQLQRALPRGDGPAGLLPGQDAGDAAAPREVRGHALQPRAELQGKPGRPARPAGDPVGGQGRRPGRFLARAGRARPDHADRGAPADAEGTRLQGHPHPPAHPYRPARGPAGVRRADAVAETVRLQDHRDPARQRIPDAALLLGGQGGHPAQYHPAAEHRGAAVSAAGLAAGRSTSASTKSTA